MSTAYSRARDQLIFGLRRRTKYELVINLRTVKMLGIEVPPSLLARADKVVD
jgi:hypothetical protein